MVIAKGAMYIYHVDTIRIKKLEILSLLTRKNLENHAI